MKNNSFLPIILFIISAINLFLCTFTGYVSLIPAVLIGIWTIINIKKKDILYSICLGISIVSIVIFLLVNIFGVLNVNNQLDESSSDKFVKVATNTISVVKDDYISHNYKKTKCYSVSDINKIRGYKNKFVYSPDGFKYSDTSFVKAYKDNNGVVLLSLCLIDENNTGFNYIDQDNINKSNLRVGDADLCVLPSNCE